MSYTSTEEMDANEKYVLATDVALSAICGEGVYNLGEVIATPVLNGLKGTPNNWLLELILALYNGDISKFNAVIETNNEKYFSQPALTSNHESIKRKAVLLGLLNVAFDRDPHDREIKFSEISTKTCIPLDHVEWALMKAFSIGIIRGTINEIAEKVSISWVQPRTLDEGHLNRVTAAVRMWNDRYAGVDFYAMS